MRKLVFFLLGGLAQAHIGSPDVFQDGAAGPYPVFVTIRPPSVIPGVAEIEIRTTATDVRSIHIVPTPITGPGAKFAPTPDLAVRSKDDPQFFTGSLWLMAVGSWQVRVSVDGERGTGSFAVPVPAAPSSLARMQFGIGAGLLMLTLLLTVGAASIVGAAVREGRLEPGAQPDDRLRRRARVGMGAAGAFLVLILWGGNSWWTSEAKNYGVRVYKPLKMTPSLVDGRLKLELESSWLNVKTDDFLPDHGHLMHLYVLRLPGMEQVWHLHPERSASGVFAQDLPPMPAGRYALYGDVVHENGFPETMAAEMDLPEIPGKPLQGDDAGGSGPALGHNPDPLVSDLGDGDRMVWVREPGPVKAGKASRFAFRVEDKDGKPAQDLELYMGMPGHAAFVKADRTVFAHVHPSGSVPMAALELANPTQDPHAGHTMALPATVSFPYGIPQAGEYRVIVQIKRGGKVETGLFDFRAEP